MDLLILSALARVQRDTKVVLHHFIFEGSHPHILCTAKDANQCKEFYGQLQKQLTDSVKRLLDISQLNLWEGRPSIIQLPTLEDAINKVGYLYSNPSNDDLESCIERYPGLSSWEWFQQAEALDTCSRTLHPWVRQPMVPGLPSSSVSKDQDEFLCEKMLELAKTSHLLEVHPLSWIELFNEQASTKEVAQIKKEVIENLRAREEENRRRRVKEGKKVLGATKLKQQPLLKPHTPKKRNRKIFVQTLFKELRASIIEEMCELDALCREVYDHWKRGDFSIPWPPGTFPPPLPPSANALCW